MKEISITHKPKSMTTTCGSIMFRIDVYWEDSDCDVRFCEFTRMFPEKHINSYKHTPIGGAVDAVLSLILDSSKYPDMRQRWFGKYHDKVNFTEYCGLMMNNCHVIGEMNAEDFSPTALKDITMMIHKLFKRYMKYYKEKEVVASNRIGMTVAGGA